MLGINVYQREEKEPGCFYLRSQRLQEQRTHMKKRERERCEATGREAVGDRVGRERDREGDRVRLLLS